MSLRPAGGKNSGRGHGTPPESSPDTPLAYALRVMGDDSAPMNLRASMAKAALPYLHWRLPLGEPPPLPPEEQPEMSRTEIARRIAFLLDSTIPDENSPD